MVWLWPDRDITPVRGKGRTPGAERDRHIDERVDCTRRVGGRAGARRGVGVRVAGLSAGKERRRRTDAAERGDVHGTRRQRLASRRAGREELRSDAGVRHPVRVGPSPDRGQVRDRLRRPLCRYRATEPTGGDPVPGAVAGVADRLGFGAGSPRVGRDDRVALRRCGHLLEPAEGRAGIEALQETVQVDGRIGLGDTASR